MTVKTAEAVAHYRSWIYRVPARRCIAIVFVFTVCAAVILVGEFLKLRALGRSPTLVVWDSAIVAVCSALLWSFLRRVMTVRFSGLDVVLNGLWKLPWTNVGNANLVFILGSPHIRIRALKGVFRFVPFWIPLYYVGCPPMSQLLQQILPRTNPVRSCLDRVVVEGDESV